MTKAIDAAARAELGVLEWFRPGEYERVEATVEMLKRLGIRHLRTGISWADHHTEQGSDWHTWLIPRLGSEFELLPCFTYTPPSRAIAYCTAAPPLVPKDFADFIDVMLTRFGRYFSHVELWNEPNNLNDWDWRQDPQWRIFADMIGKAAYWAHHRGWKTVLGGMCPVDCGWLALMARAEALEHIDVVGLHGFPGTWESIDLGWPGWEALTSQVRSALARQGLAPELWITECGYSTWRHDEAGQVETFLNMIDAPVGRAYWYALQDLDPELSSQEGFHFDERHYHLGLFDTDRRPKLLARALSREGISGARRLRALRDRSRRSRHRQHGPTIVLTGGAGFLGSNLADRLAGEGCEVVIVDSLARDNVAANIDWLLERHGRRVNVEIADVRDPYVLRDVTARVEAVFHFAAQVAVTQSLRRPREDFDVNASGTLNLLEALRRCAEPPPLFFASTNKVYGNLESIAITRDGMSYRPVDWSIHERGIDESWPISLQSPYGCSKGAADQYVLDYARHFGLPASVLRMSCLYGPRQFGTEDQGWLAHFVISALQGVPIVIYGDGCQVRDVLYVDDAVDAFLLAWRRVDRVAGRAFNLGGGPANAVNLHQAVAAIERLVGLRLSVSYSPARPGDQLYYVSDTTRFADATGWQPAWPWREGLARLRDWAAEITGTELVSR